MHSITDGETTITPTVVDGYQADRDARSIVHEILGRSAADVTARPASLRTGTLRLGFVGSTAEEDSKEAEDLHATGALLVFSSSELPTIDMSYVVPLGGRITRELENTTRAAWMLTVTFQEVSAE